MRERWLDLRAANDRALRDRQRYFARRWPIEPRPPNPPRDLRCRFNGCEEPISSSATEACVAHVCEHPDCGRRKQTFQHCEAHEHDEDLRAWVASHMTDRERCHETVDEWPYDPGDMKLIANLMRELALEPLANGSGPRPANRFLEAAAEKLDGPNRKYVEWPDDPPRRNALMKDRRNGRRVQNPATGQSWCVPYDLYRNFWTAHYWRIMPADDWRIPEQLTADDELCRYLELGSAREVKEAIAKHAEWLHSIDDGDRGYLIDGWALETGLLVAGAERQ